LDKYIHRSFVRKQCVMDVANKVMEMHLDKWNIDLQRNSAISGTGGNKLILYRLYKGCYRVEQYCKIHMSFAHRSSLAKFRCGVAPKRIETGRYEKLPVHERKCPPIPALVQDGGHYWSKAGG